MFIKFITIFFLLFITDFQHLQTKFPPNYFVISGVYSGNLIYNTRY